MPTTAASNVARAAAAAERADRARAATARRAGARADVRAAPARRASRPRGAPDRCAARRRGTAPTPLLGEREPRGLRVEAVQAAGARPARAAGAASRGRRARRRRRRRSRCRAIASRSSALRDRAARGERVERRPGDVEQQHRAGVGGRSARSHAGDACAASCPGGTVTRHRVERPRRSSLTIVVLAADDRHVDARRPSGARGSTRGWPRSGSARRDVARRARYGPAADRQPRAAPRDRAAGPPTGARGRIGTSASGWSSKPSDAAAQREHDGQRADRAATRSMSCSCGREARVRAAPHVAVRERRRRRR